MRWCTKALAREGLNDNHWARDGQKAGATNRQRAGGNGAKADSKPVTKRTRIN